MDLLFFALFDSLHRYVNMKTMLYILDKLWN